jgi:hypothetical protein
MGSRKTSSRPRKTNLRLRKRRLRKTNRILRKTKQVISKNISKKTKQKRYKYRGGSDDEMAAATAARHRRIAAIGSAGTRDPAQQAQDEKANIGELWRIMGIFYDVEAGETLKMKGSIYQYRPEALIGYLVGLNTAYNNTTTPDLVTKGYRQGGLFNVSYPGLGIMAGCMLIVLHRMHEKGQWQDDILKTALSAEFIQGVYASIDNWFKDTGPQICTSYIFKLIPGYFVASDGGNEGNWRRNRFTEFREMVVDAVTALELQLPTLRVQGVALGVASVMTDMTFDTAIDKLISDYQQRRVAPTHIIGVLETILEKLRAPLGAAGAAGFLALGPQVGDVVEGGEE